MCETDSDEILVADQRENRRLALARAEDPAYEILRAGHGKFHRRDCRNWAIQLSHGASSLRMMRETGKHRGAPWPDADDYMTLPDAYDRWLSLSARNPRRARNLLCRVCQPEELFLEEKLRRS